MPRVGDCEWPGQTWVEDRTELVLGRVRKVVVLTGIWDRFNTRAEAAATRERVLGELERFDHGEIPAEARTGRVFYGTRRRLDVTLDPEERILVVRAELLAADRFERAAEPEEVSVVLSGLPGAVSLSTPGNWSAPLRVELATTGSWSGLVLTGGGQALTVHTTLDSGVVLVVDGETEAVTLAGENSLALTNGRFPVVSPPGSDLELSAGSGSGALTVTVSWLPRWV